jgi:hypothetical protein
VIGDDGHILKVYPSVDPASHARQIVRDLGADKLPPTPIPTATPPATPAGQSISAPKSRTGGHADSDDEPD